MAALKESRKREFGFRRYMAHNGTTYVFLFAPRNVDRAHRVASLNNVCIVARDEFID